MACCRASQLDPPKRSPWLNMWSKDFPNPKIDGRAPSLSSQALQNWLNLWSIDFPNPKTDCRTPSLILPTLPNGERMANLLSTCLENPKTDCRASQLDPPKPSRVVEPAVDMTSQSSHPLQTIETETVNLEPKSKTENPRKKKKRVPKTEAKDRKERPKDCPDWIRAFNLDPAESPGDQSLRTLHRRGKSKTVAAEAGSHHLEGGYSEASHHSPYRRIAP